MKVTKDESATRQVTLHVALDSEDLEPFLERAYKRNKSRVSIPGFRPGKAPRYIVEAFLGRETLVRDSLDYIVQESLTQAISDEALDAFGQPDVEVEEVDPVSFTAIVPLEPVIDLGDIRQLDVARGTVEITDEQVGLVLEQLQYNAAPWEPMDRPIQFGDLVTLDVDGTIKGNQVANDKGVDFIPAQDNPYPFPGFSIYLEGLKTDDSRQFTLEVPDDFQDTTIAGEDCSFDVKILQIKAKDLPEIDDEFAKGIEDGYESLEALKTSILENLTSESEQRATREFQETALEKLISGTSIEVSDATVEREIDHLLEEQARNLQGRDADVETYLQNAGKSAEETRDELRPPARERLSRYLVIRKLAQDEHLEVIPEEIYAEIERLVSGTTGSSDALLRAFSTDEAKASLGSALLTRKVLGRLGQMVEETDEDPEDSEDDAAQPEIDEEPAEDEETESPSSTS